MNKLFFYISFGFFVLLSLDLMGQKVLALEEAVQLALANNYAIKIQQFEVEKSALQIDPSLVGKKPTINLNASYELGYADTRTETIPFGGEPGGGNNIINLNGVSNDIIVGPELNLLLLDGKASNYRLEQLTTLNEVAKLQLKQTMEQTIAEVTGAYLQMAQTQSLINITEQSMALVENRLARAKSDAKYGTSNSLQALQIEVDLKTDSANWHNLQLQLENARRSLNQIIGQDLEDNYLVDTELTVNTNLNIRDLESSLREQNTILFLNDQTIKNADLEIQLTQAAYKPTLQGYANLNFVYLQDQANFLQSNRLIGPNVGVRFQYPLFDGGARKIRGQVAVVNKKQKELEKEDTEVDLVKELRNAYALYQNNLTQLRIEQSNLPAFERNLENMTNNYQLGLVTNTDVRTAQLNLNAALNRINNYQYTIKQSEVTLYLLAGMLVE